MFFINMIIYALYIFVITVLVALDQLSKFLIVKNVRLNQSIPMIKDFFNITYVKNFGAGFSILQNQTYALLAFTLIAIVIIISLLVKTNKHNKFEIICLLLIISGAIGNFIDRLRLTYVVDFLDFIIFGYNFPVFNLADCFITIGCFLLMIEVILENKNAKN